VTPVLRRFGASESPVVVIDDATGMRDQAVELAAAMAPFPSGQGNYYPGLRRPITEADAAAYDYVARMLEAAAPYIGGGFDLDRFDLIEASFSMVTAAPGTLAHAQRAPHFDSTDPDYIAVLHYLGGAERTGTAFYRQRSTGIETVDDANLERFVTTARREGTEARGYIADSNAWYERIGAVEARPDRLVVYRGCLLHSGIIPPGHALDPDPRRGRLTANIFIKGYRA
jgi:hypothetical protein